MIRTLAQTLRVHQWAKNALAALPLLMAHRLGDAAGWLRLKRKLMLDVLALASLYTLRLLGGRAAAHVELSFWLLAFSMFLFLNLAFIKRYAELEMSLRQGTTTQYGRAYVVTDLDLI